jgi:LytS/YehU family sensor histidine kinase
VFLGIFLAVFAGTEISNKNVESALPSFAIFEYLISLLIFFFILLISIGATLYKEWYAAERRNEVMLFEKTAAELSFLKSQINPHFLFNTLNNIYALSRKDPEQSSASILKLSQIMRYVLQESMNEMVELSKEVEYIGQYIDLQKIRLTDQVKVIYMVEGNAWNVSVFPLLFLPFIENAFKYGVSTHEPSEILITIIADTQELILKVQNTMVKNTYPGAEAGGVGLTNVKRRLELLYPGRHHLMIDQKNNKFVVELKIIR